MTSLEKYKAALSRGEEIINMGLCGFDEQSAKTSQTPTTAPCR